MAEIPEVSVIMPTLGRSARASLIHRSVQSVISQESVRAIPIVVVNGPHRDFSLVRSLQLDSRLRVLDLEAPGIPGALRAGREAVETEWFSALDDDDVCLPGSLAARVERLQSTPACDTVVTNGLICDVAGERLYPDDLTAVECDPLGALTESNWLLPGAWLCRSDRVGAWLFDGMPGALECTYLALQFALHCRPCFLDRPSVAYQDDTPDSESNSPDYVHRLVPALEQMLELPLSGKTRNWIRRALTAAKHRVSGTHLQNQELAKAWQWHARSLVGPGGWRYASYTFRLLLTTMRN
jgi:glycosyltransferase involved in cell wall biosynthesis